ncbi:MAG: PHP domain-containing protein [Deltaproteobacteria bacterium]|nr:PHP domain-containing protein [Deltaproteobacteria bacterium]
MPFSIDLHIHTTFSGDSTVAPEEAIERAIALGLDGVAFTEHNSFAASDPVERLKEKYGGSILILRGVEYSSSDGHMLLFGIDERVVSALGRYAPAFDVIRAVKEANGVAIVAHPFREWALFRSDLSTFNFTAIEAFNGHNNDEENRQALVAAGSLRLPTTGGSDSHSPAEVGVCYTEFPGRVTEENFVEALILGGYCGMYRKQLP